MIIDSSAVVAILRREPDAHRFAISISGAVEKRISAANYFEAAIVFESSRSRVPSRQFDEFFLTSGINVEPVTEVHARLAREAYRDYGRCSGHPARLNFGDCFAYALARATGEPLLFKGDDFSHTDLRSALA